MAPEVIRQETDIDASSDVYSYGVLFWELCHRKIPFETFSNPHTIMYAVAGPKQLRPTFDQAVPGAILYLVEVNQLCLAPQCVRSRIIYTLCLGYEFSVAGMPKNGSARASVSFLKRCDAFHDVALF